jgi:hypothetical protein
MDLETDVVAGSQDAFSGMQSHPNLDRGAGRPAVADENSLRCYGRADRFPSGGEHREDCVALVENLDALIGSDGPAEDLAMVDQDLWPTIAQGPGQLRRPFDIGK